MRTHASSRGLEETTLTGFVGVFFFLKGQYFLSEESVCAM